MEESRKMTLKSSTPKSEAGRAPSVPAGLPPFARLDHKDRAMIEEFEREHMGIAAKE
jgi:hypothetical protein